MPKNGDTKVERCPICIGKRTKYFQVPKMSREEAWGFEHLKKREGRWVCEGEINGEHAKLEAMRSRRR